MLRPRGNLLFDVLEHHVALNNHEAAIIDRNDRAVSAEMFAATGGLRIADDTLAAVWHGQKGIFLKSRKIVACRDFEFLFFEKNKIILSPVRMCVSFIRQPPGDAGDLFFKLPPDDTVDTD